MWSNTLGPMKILSLFLPIETLQSFSKGMFTHSFPSSSHSVMEIKHTLLAFHFWDILYNSKLSSVHLRTYGEEDQQPSGLHLPNFKAMFFCDV